MQLDRVAGLDREIDCKGHAYCRKFFNNPKVFGNKPPGHSPDSSIIFIVCRCKEKSEEDSG